MAKNQNGVVKEGDQCQHLLAEKEREKGETDGERSLLNDVDGFPKIL